MADERLDKLLVKLGLVSTRVRAEKIIREDGVKVNGILITKTSKKFPADSKIELVAEEIPWVSKSALKLIGAIENWELTIQDQSFLDVGVSTGGFTEILLHRGAAKVFCVNVGGGQLHHSILQNSKVINLEKTQVRELTPRLITEKVAGCVVEVDFLSLEKIIPFVHSFIQPNGFLIAVIKPQYEVNKEDLAKGGIVKDKKLYPLVINKMKQLASTNNLTFIDFIESPILGKNGNQEFLMYFSKSAH